MTYLLQAHSDGPYVWVADNLPVWDGRAPNPFDLVTAGDVEALGFTPRFVQRNRGSRWGDLLWTTGNTKIMSRRFLEVLKAVHATGWKAFGVEINGKGRRTVEGYVGLAVTGRSDHDDLAHQNGVAFWDFEASDRLVQALRDAGVTDLMIKPITMSR